jgi:hypothetical protein
VNYLRWSARIVARGRLRSQSEKSCHRFLEPIDSVVTQRSHQLHATFMNQSVKIWPQRETLSRAVRAFPMDGLVWRGSKLGTASCWIQRCRHPPGWEHEMKKMGRMEAPQMAVNDHAEHVRILSSVLEGIEGLRRRIQELQPDYQPA